MLLAETKLKCSLHNPGVLELCHTEFTSVSVINGFQSILTMLVREQTDGVQCT
jgi:hypothetical protein